MVGCYRCLVFTYFLEDFALGIYVSHIFCCDNRIYSLYNSANIENDLDEPDKQLYNITIRYFLCYFETNKWHRY